MANHYFVAVVVWYIQTRGLQTVIASAKTRQLFDATSSNRKLTGSQGWVKSIFVYIYIPEALLFKIQFNDASPKEIYQTVRLFQVRVSINGVWI